MFASNIKAFKESLEPIMNLVKITCEKDYHKANDFLGEVIDASQGKEGENLFPLIDILVNAIDKYEEQDSELMKFVETANNIPGHIALINVLIDQYNLTGDDLPEIGDKLMVSRVLNGVSPLSDSAIENLSARFKLRPDFFL
jgi:HTH-type transcriptional regulator/antitoxin HigA